MAESITALQTTTLADILERVLDKGIVIVGDIKINLADVELLTVKIRLLIASVERAKQMGIDWWETDKMFSSKARELTERLEKLESKIKSGSSTEELDK